MRKVLFFLLLAAALVVGLGYYLNWFTVVSNINDEHPNVSITVDKGKIKSDVQEAKEKITSSVGNATEKAKDSTQPGADR